MVAGQLAPCDYRIELRVELQAGRCQYSTRRSFACNPGKDLERLIKNRFRQSKSAQQ